MPPLYQLIMLPAGGSRRAGPWDTIVKALTAPVDAEGLVDWSVSVDSTIARAHQYATNTTHPTMD